MSRDHRSSAQAPWAATLHYLAMAGERSGPLAILVYRDGNARQRTFALNSATERVRIGRGTAAELRLGWDRQASRVHAELERLGDGWALIDDGLSANGTRVNDERLLGRRRLSEGDEIRIGTTSLTFRTIADSESLTLIPTLDDAGGRRGGRRLGTGDRARGRRDHRPRPGHPAWRRAPRAA